MDRHYSTALEDLIRQGATADVIRRELGRRGVRQCDVCGCLYLHRDGCNACAAREWRARHARAALEPRRFAGHEYIEDGQIGVEIEDLARAAIDPLKSNLPAEQTAQALGLRVPVPVDEEVETPQEEKERRNAERKHRRKNARPRPLTPAQTVRRRFCRPSDARPPGLAAPRSPVPPAAAGGV
jgi:hypothetical protein